MFQSYRQFRAKARADVEIIYMTIDEAVLWVKRELGLSTDQAQTIVRNVDLNQDGRISPSELDTMKAIVSEIKERLLARFETFDPNKEGFVSMENARTILKEELIGMPEKTISIMIDRYDADKNGKFDFGEFILFYSYAKSQASGDLKIYMTIDEAVVWVEKELGLSTDQAKTIVNNVDLNQDGRISPEELDTMKAIVSEIKNRLVARFEVFDTNKEGFVSMENARTILKEELQGMPEKTIDIMMNRYDADKNGKFDFGEFVLFYSYAKSQASGDLKIYMTIDEAVVWVEKELGLSTDQAKTIVNNVDLNQDGRISPDELNTMKAIVSEIKDRLLARFEVFDTNKEGFVSKESARTILKEELQDMPEETISIMIDRYDADNNGKFDFGEFILFYSYARANKDDVERKLKEMESDNNKTLSAD